MNAPRTPDPAPARGSGYLELLAGLLEAFSRTRDLGATLADALVRIAEAMNAEAAAIFQLEGEFGTPGARLICRAHYGPVDITGLSLPAESGIVGRALSANAALIVPDVSEVPEFVPPPGTGFSVRSVLCAPLSHRDERFGVVELLNRRGGCAAGPGQFALEDLDALSALAAAAGLAIANARMAEAMLEQESLKRELELAAAVQRNLLPPAQDAGAAVHGLSRPARGVSGDFYDILALPDGRTVFALADVSGKGMNAALIMVKAATLFRSWAKRMPEPGKLLARIEAELCETMSFGMFVTMVVGLYDPRRHELRLSNAGHEPPLLRHPDGRFESFPALDPPLGIQCKLENNRYRELRVPLGGGALYLFTDGATEGRLADGSQPGSEGMPALISAHAAAAPAQRLQAIAAHYGSELRDDLTLLVIEDQACQQAARPRSFGARRRPALLVTQTIPARADQLKIVRRLVEAASLSAGADPAWAGDLVLAVDEAFQNVIRHAYCGCEGKVQLLMYRRRDQLVVELVDHGRPVDRSACRGRKLEELRPGGLGTHFMHALTDRVRYLRPAGEAAGNRLVMSKTLPAATA